MNIKIKRVYESPEKADGYRILVDRLWPRGLSKEKAAVDLWLKEIGPSNELRKWFGHVPDKFPDFKTKYEKELKEKNDLISQIKDHAKKGTVTLVYSAKDIEHNQAVVLQSFLQ